MSRARASALLRAAIVCRSRGDLNAETELLHRCLQRAKSSRQRVDHLPLVENIV